MSVTHLLRGSQSAPVVSKGQNWGKRRSGVSDRSGEESAGLAGFHSSQPHCCGSSSSAACSSFLLYKTVRGKDKITVFTMLYLVSKQPLARHAPETDLDAKLCIGKFAYISMLT